MLFIVYPTAHTYSVILIPLLVGSYLYYHGISSTISTNYFHILKSLAKRDPLISIHYSI